MADIVENSTNTIIGIIVSVVLICSAMIPIVIQQLRYLAGDEFSDYASTISSWTGIIEIVVIMAIIGLIVAVVRGYSKRETD